MLKIAGVNKNAVEKCCMMAASAVFDGSKESLLSMEIKKIRPGRVSFLPEVKKNNNNNQFPSI